MARDVQYGTIVAEGLIPSEVKMRIRDDDRLSYSYYDEDYDNFGGGTFVGVEKLKYKGKTKDGKLKQTDKFLKEEFRKLSPGHVKAVICDDAGYIGYKIGFVKDIFTEKIVGPLDIITLDLNFNYCNYKNITELKKDLNRMSASDLQRLYGSKVCDVNGNVIGKIGVTEKRVYKTKPKACPKKFTSVDLLAKVMVYGYV